jgi:predicted XRE-type DNA-binding protein
MSNFFSFDSGYQYEPVVKQLDQKIIDNDLSHLRRKILESIKQIVDQKDLSRAELAMAARINRPVAGQIHRGSTEKISTDRLLMFVRNLDGANFYSFPDIDAIKNSCSASAGDR